MHFKEFALGLAQLNPKLHLKRDSQGFEVCR